MNDLECIAGSKSILGEGPLYNESEDSLYWTDIKANKILKYNLGTKKVTSYQFNKQIGSFAFIKNTSLTDLDNHKIIATTNDGYELLDLDSSIITPIVNPEYDKINNRFNDGKCDFNGRYFAGTMDNLEQDIRGSLYCLEQNSVTKKEDDLFISNGLGWNNDSTKFYLTDSPKRIIYVYDYDLKTGSISNKQIFARINPSEGYPDGLCVDAEDHVWSAHWNGWRVTRYKPNGEIESVYKLPVPKVTSCNFAGKNLDKLFITTASIDLSEEELAEAPLSGCTFCLKTNVKGQKSNLFTM